MSHNLKSVRSSSAELECIYTGRTKEIECTATILVTMRIPVDDLWKSNHKLDRIGDAMGPSTIGCCNLQWAPLCEGSVTQQLTKYLFDEN